MSESMTLAFDIEALERLDDIEAVFRDARRWSSFVGVISDRMAYQVVNYLRDRGVYDEDFFSRADKAHSLKHVKGQTGTERYVYVGCTDADADLARDHGWEFLSVEEAARAAAWDLAPAVEGC